MATRRTIGKSLGILILLTLTGCADRRPAQRENSDEPNREAWLLDGVKFYRKLGFFQQFQGQTDEEIVSRISATISDWEKVEYYGGRDRVRMHLDPGDPRAEPTLLCFAVGAGFATPDLELGALPGNHVYVDTVADFAAISRGAFQPTNIREDWDEKGLTLRFTLDGDVHRLRLAGTDFPDRDWLDASMFLEIDRLLWAKGYHLVEYGPLEEQVYFVLTEHERKTIEEQRGLKLWDAKTAYQHNLPDELLNATQPSTPAWRFF